jgi:hypothetical protein
MVHDLMVFDGYVARSNWPHVSCPACTRGFLVPAVLEAVPSEQSKRAKSHESWEPDWISGTFYGLLKCAAPSCGETVTITGDFKVGPLLESDGSWYGEYDDMFRLRFALPALPILTLPAETPKDVKQAIEHASRVLWIDPSAAANRLRFAIEALLTHLRIPRFVISKGKRSRVTTHVRIVKLKKSKLDAGEALEAVKWIGNSGSHEDTLTVSDVLDSAVMFGRALRLIYNRSDQELQRRIRAVNKAKGIPRDTTKKA